MANFSTLIVNNLFFPSVHGDFLIFILQGERQNNFAILKIMFLTLVFFGGISVTLNI